MKGFARRLAPLLVLAASTSPLLAPLAHAADPGAKAAAESLFQEGRKLMDAKRYAEACPKFAESQRLDPTLGTQINLARCHELEGKTATAWAEYLEVGRLATNAGQKARGETALDLAKALEGKLARLRIEAKGAPAGVVIERDGVPVGEGALGTLVAVDPGPHTIAATAPGYEPWSTSVTVEAGPSEKTVTVPALVKVTVAPTPEPSEPQPASGGGKRLAGFVLGGVGIAALGVGTVFGVMTLSDASNAASDPTLCPNNVCTPAGRTAIERAETKAWVSTIGLAAGVAAVGAGLTLWLLAPAKAPSKEAASVLPFVTAAPGGLGLGAIGRF